MKKGVSPLIAVILVLVFTVAISTAILAWLTDYTKTTTQAASSGTSGPKGIVACANSIVEISNVNLKYVPITSNTSVVSGTTNNYNITSITSSPTITFTGRESWVLPDNLVGWWIFDDTNDFTDHSAYSNDGTNNGSTYTASGKFGGARSFDGVNDSINGSLSGNSITNEFTISGWVKLDNPGVDQTHISFGNSSGIYLESYVNMYDLPVCKFTNRSGDVVKQVQGLTALTQGMWNNVACTYNSSHGSIYVNGVFQTSVPWVISFTTNDYVIGRSVSLNASNWAEKVGATVFESALSNSISAATLNNGNIFIAYQDWGNSEYGTFVIYDSDGNEVKAPTVFESAQSSDISTTTFTDGNVLIVYSDEENFNKGTFVIYDSEGNEVKAPTVFDDDWAWTISTTTLTNGNVLIAYEDGGNSWYGTFVIYDSEGNEVKESTVFYEGDSDPIYTTTLTNGNVVIAYTDLDYSGYGTFVIYDSDGNEVKAPTVFASAFILQISTTTLTDGNVLIAYKDFLNSGYGTFVIYDSDGNEIKAPTVFASASSSSISATTLTNGNVLIAYIDEVNSGYGTFVIYDSDGTEIKSPTVFESASTSQIYSTTLTNGNVLIAYRDNGNSNYGTFVIYEGEGTFLNDNFFNGSIDEVRIYNKSLSALEIIDDYSKSTLLSSIGSKMPKASINGYDNITYDGNLTNGQKATVDVAMNNFTIGVNNVTIYTDDGIVDYSINMNQFSAIVTNTGMNNVTVKQVVAFKADGSNCVFPDSNNTFEVGDVFSISGCPMSCDEFLTIKAYTDCTGVFGEFVGTPNGC